MEESINDLHKTLAKDPLNLNRNVNRRSDGQDQLRRKTNVVDEDEECDSEVWETLSSSFQRVQSVLDQNRALIQQVNENHQSKIPDNLVKNVALIREINGNISKVVSMYADLSHDFTNLVRQRKALSRNNSGEVKSSSGNGGSEVVDAAID